MLYTLHVLIPISMLSHQAPTAINVFDPSTRKVFKSAGGSMGILESLFGGKKSKGDNLSSNRSTTSSIGSTPNKAVTGSWFGRGKKKGSAAEIDEFFNIKVWSSKMCLFAFNILTRDARLATLNVAVRSYTCRSHNRPCYNHFSLYPSSNILSL